MAKLPEEVNPFNKKTVYEEFGLDPFASEAELMEQFERMPATFGDLSDEEKMQKLQAIQVGMKTLRNRASRAEVNALMLEKVDVKTIVQRLRNLSLTDISAVKLPEPGAELLFSDADCPEVAVGEEGDITPPADLELDLDELAKELGQHVNEHRFLFEL